MYDIIDLEGNKVRTFYNLVIAYQYKALSGRPDWMVVERQSTSAQKRAVRFCEHVLKISFRGDINSYYKVSLFLKDNLEKAKQLIKE